MAQVIATNVSSINAQRNLMNSQATMQTSLQRLSSGLRINSAKDDAAGLGVSENLTAQIRGLNVAMRNANDGISVLQTAEGSTDEVSNIIQRMRELAVQSASDTLADDERAYIQDEFTQLTGEVDRIANLSEFNGVQLADGSSATLDVQVGTGDTANDRIQMTLGDLRAATLGVDGGSIDLSTSAGAQAALTTLDTAQDTVSGYRSDYGAVQNRLESAVRNISNTSENLSAARSRIRDADFATETANLTRSQILQQAGTAMLAQANAVSQNVLSLLR